MAARIPKVYQIHVQAGCHNQPGTSFVCVSRLTLLCLMDSWNASASTKTNGRNSLTANNSTMRYLLPMRLVSLKNGHGLWNWSLSKYSDLTSFRKLCKTMCSERWASDSCHHLFLISSSPTKTRVVQHHWSSSFLELIRCSSSLTLLQSRRRKSLWR